MVLTRHASKYILTYYLPSGKANSTAIKKTLSFTGLFVFASWVSFLIPHDVIAGRIVLLVALFLILVNIFNTVTINTPRAEGLNAIEFWVLTCLLFVFGALLE